MNTKFKNFIFNGGTYGVVFFLLSFFMYYNWVNLPFKTAAIDSVPVALVAMTLNGLTQSRFTRSSRKLQSIQIQSEDFEIVRIQSPANHMIDDHLISGKLLLSERRLVFRSFEQEEYSWQLDDLYPSKFYPSIFNAGGEFIILNGNQDKLIFEVDEMKVWKKALTNNLPRMKTENG